ncbi:hypothetical protein [Enterococcus faecalis]|uniref:hypothetical protein n=1 Tax=Enterococcus faecalis TaxID=1351 RepID=UPI0034CFAFA7
MSHLSKINDLAFDLTHEYMEPGKQFSYGKQIYDLSDESELNENQQVVLNWLKTPPLFPISAIHLLEAGKNVPENVKKAYENFDKKEEAEVLQAFSQWTLEQEEQE